MYLWNLFQYLITGTTVCLIFIVYRISNHFLKLRRINYQLSKLPSDPRHWFWGHMDKFPGTGEEGLAYFREITRRYPRAYGFWFGCFAIPSVVVHHPETIKSILKVPGMKSITSGFYKFGKGWIGNGLITSSGAKWHRNRRLLTNLFHFDALKQYISVQNIATEFFLIKLSKLSESGNYFDITGIINPLTFDIFLRCAFSFESDVQTIGKEYFFIKVAQNLMKLWNRRIFNPLGQSDFVYKFTKDGKKFKSLAEQAHKLSDGFIRERKKAMEENGKNGDKCDFLDILIKARDENGIGLSDIEIRDEVDTFMAAGFETVSNALSWLFYSLANHPEHQKHCQEEVDAVLVGRLDDSFEWIDLQKLTYLTMCIKESFRLYGSVPMVQRELACPTVVDGVELAEGTHVLLNFYSLHHNPDVWKNPMKFDPSRFAPGNVETIDSFALLPFSAGSRNCIGQAFALEELKVVAAKTLKRFTFDADPNLTPKKQMQMLLRPANGISLKVTKRNNQN